MSEISSLGPLNSIPGFADETACVSFYQKHTNDIYEFLLNVHYAYENNDANLAYDIADHCDQFDMAITSHSTYCQIIVTMLLDLFAQKFMDGQLCFDTRINTPEHAGKYIQGLLESAPHRAAALGWERDPVHPAMEEEEPPEASVNG